jgi:hypothetical protein
MFSSIFNSLLLLHLYLEFQWVTGSKVSFIFANFSSVRLWQNWILWTQQRNKLVLRAACSITMITRMMKCIRTVFFSHTRRRVAYHYIKKNKKGKETLQQTHPLSRFKGTNTHVNNKRFGRIVSEANILV